MGFFIKVCLVVLGTFLSSFIVPNECKRLEGYKFPVYSTSFCPRSKTEWENRSNAINCTARSGYMCMPNENLTELLEFCYTEPGLWILKGYCFYLVKRVSKVNTYDCSQFSYGCHNYSFLSTRIYEHPACIAIGNGCFLAEPFCESTLTTSNTIKSKTDWVGIVALCVFSVVFLAFIMSLIWRSKGTQAFSICKGNIDVELHQSDLCEPLTRENQNDKNSTLEGYRKRRTGVEKQDPEEHTTLINDNQHNIKDSTSKGMIYLKITMSF